MLEEIVRCFGTYVVELVGWLTDVSPPTDGNRAIRQALDCDHSAAAPARAQTIKVADLIDNTSSIARHDPEFARVYLREKAALLDVLMRADGGLIRRARCLVTSRNR